MFYSCNICKMPLTGTYYFSHPDRSDWLCCEACFAEQFAGEEFVDTLITPGATGSA